MIPAGLIFLVLFLLTSCNRPDVIHDLSNESYSMITQDSTSVQFPKHFEGKILAIGFIYTHCPDVCPIITAKLSNIHRQLKEPEDIHFVEISFDPQRDTPAVLKNYMQSFDLDPSRFTMLTGDSASVDSVLSRLNIVAEIANTTRKEENAYLMNHTNRIMIMDRQGKVRFEYPGSFVSEEHVIEDINRLR